MIEETKNIEKIQQEKYERIKTNISLMKPVVKNNSSKVLRKIDGVWQSVEIKVVNPKTESKNIKVDEPRLVSVQEKATPSNNIKYQYYYSKKFKRNDNKNHGGVIIVATKYDKEYNLIRYGVSFCSPKDVYDKRFGKDLALKRLNEATTCQALYNIIEMRYNTISFQIITDVMNNISVPNWSYEIIGENIKKYVSEVGNC